MFLQQLKELIADIDGYYSGLDLLFLFSWKTAQCSSQRFINGFCCICNYIMWNFIMTSLLSRFYITNIFVNFHFCYFFQRKFRST